MSNLSRYNQHLGDRFEAAHDESILGHYVEELGWSLERALENLKPLTREAWESTRTSEKYSRLIATGTGILGLLLGGTVGLAGSLPIGTAALALLCWHQAKQALPRREAERLILRQCPELPQIAFLAHQKGATPAQIVGAWDLLLDGFMESEGATPQQIAGEFGRLLDAIGAKPETPQATTKATDKLPAAASISNRERATATDSATLRVENPSNQLEAVDRAVPQPPPVPTTIDELQSRLKAECPALLKLVKAHPIRLIGLQRTGKSTLAKLLGLLRLLLIPDHRVLAATPHYEASNPYPGYFQVAGYNTHGKRDTDEIESAWGQVQQAIDGGRYYGITPIWDEFGGYADFFEDPEALTVSLRSMLRESIKHGIHPIFILHGESAQFISGGKGLIRALLEGTVRVQTIGEAIDDFGTMAPTGKASIKWLDGSKQDLVLPQWLTEGLLIGLLQQAGQRPRAVTELKQNRLKLEASWQASTAAATGHPEVEPSPETEATTIDPAIELIQQEPNMAKREALEIAYRWAKNRLENGGEITREAFLNRAKNERKSEYLKENRDEIWSELEALIT